MTEEDWPYDHSDLDPSDSNGLKCGEDENGDTILWSYPTPDIAGYTVATKGTAANILSGGATNLGSGWTERAGAGYFNAADTFTAPIAGMYDFTVGALSDASSVFNIYFRMTSNYAAWGSPSLKTQVYTDAVLGGAIVLSGALPCAAGGTLVFDLIHDKGSGQDFSDCYMAFSWKSPIPS